jgi:hypothetical protein
MKIGDLYKNGAYPSDLFIVEQIRGEVIRLHRCSNGQKVRTRKQYFPHFYKKLEDFYLTNENK